MRLAECAIRDHLSLVELHWVLTNDLAGAESRTSVIWDLEKCVRAAEEDSELIRVERALVDELTAEGLLLGAGTEHSKAELDFRLVLFASWELLQ